MSFQQFGNYRFNRTIFKIAFSIIFIFLVIIALKSGSQKYIYVSCDNDAPCDNPYMQNGLCYFSLEDRLRTEELKDICSKEILLPGETLGTKPPFKMGVIISITMFILLFSLLINHLEYNRGVKCNKHELKQIREGLKKHFSKSIKKKESH